MAKKTAKKSTKKSTKKSAKKSTKKKVAKKKVAKKAATKVKAPKKIDIEEQKRLAREEAIKKYKEKNKPQIDEELLKDEEDDEIEGDDVETVVVGGDSPETAAGLNPAGVGSDVAKNEPPTTPKLSEEVDPEEEETGAGEYGFGWGYNDAFDKPDEEEEPEILDEDEIYARGLDKKKEKKKDDL